MSRDVRQQALAYLHDHQVMSLATSGPAGIWAAALFYVNYEFDLFFLSDGQTRHGQNLSAHPLAAATIQEDYADWAAIKGIQLEGAVILLAGEARQAAIERYQARYPFVANAPTTIQAALRRVNWYQLRPQRLYFIDNSKGFGHRDEIVLDER